MNDNSEQLLSLLSALKATKEAKKETMKDYKDQIQGIERQIEEIRQASVLVNNVLTATT